MEPEHLPRLEYRLLFQCINVKGEIAGIMKYSADIKHPSKNLPIIVEGNPMIFRNKYSGIVVMLLDYNSQEVDQ